MSGSTTIARAAFVAVLGLAAVPGQALASGGYYGPFGFQQEEYGPGVTVSGAGLARVNAPEQFTEDSVHQAVDAAHREGGRAGGGGCPAALRGHSGRSGHLARPDAGRRALSRLPRAGAVSPFTADG